MAEESTTIYKGDDTGAFDQNFIKIDVSGTSGYIISKCGLGLQSQPKIKSLIIPNNSLL